jgi:hypothetical protein
LFILFLKDGGKIKTFFKEGIMLNTGDYKGYATAMHQNGCRPISYGRLNWHVSHNCEVRRFKSAWIAGVEENGVFLPSHVGYNSPRDIVGLLRQLLDGDEKIYLAVKENMGKQLQKIGWVYAGRVEVDYPYPQEKVIYVNQVDMIPDWRWN